MVTWMIRLYVDCCLGFLVYLNFVVVEKTQEKE